MARLMPMKNIPIHSPGVLRRLVVVAVFLTGFVLTTSDGRAGSGFINGFDDLPLMPGMSELGGELMTFDSPTGRIIENLVHGNVESKDVQAFYSQTLPQLGWTQTRPRLFAREDEMLKLEFLAPDGISSSVQTSGPPMLTVRFRLYPAEK